jgi:hypothetical protein
MVQRLARGPFKAEIRVRFPLALPILKKANKNVGNPQLLPALLPIAKKTGVRIAMPRYYPQWTRAPWRRQSDCINSSIPHRATASSALSTPATVRRLPTCTRPPSTCATEVEQVSLHLAKMTVRLYLSAVHRHCEGGMPSYMDQ